MVTRTVEDVTDDANTSPVGALTYNSIMTCRLKTDYTREAGTYELIIFASTFEEGVTIPISTLPTPLNPGYTADDNMYEFYPAAGPTAELLGLPAVPTVSDVTVVWDPSICAWTLAVTATGIMDTDPADVVVMFGGTRQEVKAGTLTATGFTAVIVDLEYAFVDYALEIFFPAGTPEPADPSWATFPASSITPQLCQLSTAEGSLAGSTIYAQIHGVGSQDHGAVTLVRSGSATSGGYTELCVGPTTVIEYGIIQCDTVPGALSSVFVHVKTVAGGAVTNPTAPVLYQTFADPAFPSPSSQPRVSALGQYIVLNSVAFGTLTIFADTPGAIGDELECKFYYAGVKADSCTDLS